MGVLHIVQTGADPSSAPTGIGHHWVNTTTKDTWISTGTSSVADWKKVNNDAIAGGVTSVNGDTGPVVVLDTGDISEGSNLYYTDERVDDRVASLIVAGTGITSTYNDPANTLTIATTITQYTDELAQDAVGNALVDSSSIDFTYNDGANTITAAVLPAGVDHDALQNFVTNEHIDHTTVTITAGIGLTGGGDISSNRTIDLDIPELTAETTVAANDLIAIYDASASAHRKMTRSDFLAGTTTDETVKITASDTTAGYLDAKVVVASGKLTKTVLNPGGDEDLQLSIGADVFDKTVDDSGDINEGTNLFFTDERAQDAIGTILVDSSTIDFTYNDGTPSITASVIQSGIDHGSISGLADDDHTQYHNDTRADTWLATKTTTNLSEGTNLYFTDERVDDRVASLIVAGTGITSTYDDTLNTLTIASTITQYTNEQAQDAVGTILTDSSSVDFTYDDALNTITAVVLPAGVDHNALNNYVANQHIDHTTVSISAGTGLSGGGDISANRTISMPNVGTAGTYGSATQVPVLTTDAQGRVSGVTNTTIAITSAEVSDFTEAAQDAVGSALTDSGRIDFTYNDGANTITADIVANSITDTYIGAGIDATKIADGSVTNTEFQYINTLSSNAQTNIDSRVLRAGDTLTGAIIPSVVTLTDAATIAVNASLGNQFQVTITANRILGNPSSASHGQLLLFAIKQDGVGGRSISFDTKFVLGNTVSGVTLSTAANSVDYIGVRYDSVRDKFDIISFSDGYV